MTKGSKLLYFRHRHRREAASNATGATAPEREVGQPFRLQAGQWLSSVPRLNGFAWELPLS